jgi:hypothetical protein
VRKIHDTPPSSCKRCASRGFQRGESTITLPCSRGEAHNDGRQTLGGAGGVRGAELTAVKPGCAAARLRAADEVGGGTEGALGVEAAVEDVVAAGHGQREAALRGRQLAAAPLPHVDGVGGAAEQRLQGGVPLRVASGLLCHRRHVAHARKGGGGHPAARVAVWGGGWGGVGGQGWVTAANARSHEHAGSRSFDPSAYRCRCGPHRNRQPRFRGGGPARACPPPGAVSPAPQEPSGALAPCPGERFVVIPMAA